VNLREAYLTWWANALVNETPRDCVCVCVSDRWSWGKIRMSKKGEWV
jgi:hypothetical protein